MILIVSHERDQHAEAVQRELADMGAPATLLDLSAFPRDLALSLRYGTGDGCDFTLGPLDGKEVDLRQVRAVWWRRPQPFGLDPLLRRQSHRSFAYGESIEAFAGLWQTLDVFWINHPSRDEIAARKAMQLAVAREVGLDIPDTLITNDPGRAREFIERRGPERTIFKSFSATETEWRETRLVLGDELSCLDHVRFAPVIFQEYVEAIVDLRVTVVGDRVFPAAIHSQESSYKIDFRMDLGRVPIEETSLPDEVVAALHRLMRRLGIVYGAIDMRRTPDGRHVFLEVNPAGQWLFVEEETGQPITATLAGRLAEAGRRERGTGLPLPVRIDRRHEEEPPGEEAGAACG